MMIKQFWAVYKSDVQRYTENKELLPWGGNKSLIINAFIGINHRLAFQFWLRLLASNPRGIIKIISKLMHRHYKVKYGLQIPASTIIGPGLYIGHGISIVINGNTKIGSNCNISQFLTIGSNKGTPATIGDNVYIGPNVCIVEDVKIGNNVKIGAGTIVIHDVPDNCTTVGNPNRIIKK